MPEVSVKDQIKKLVELQKFDEQIYAIKKDLVEKPAAIQQLKEEFESKKEKLKNLEEKFKAVQLKRKEIELDLKSKEDNIIKANSQLSQIKTNKEYTAKLTEIESIKADRSILEEKILISYDEGDTVTKEIEAEKKIVADHEKVFQTRSREVEDEIKVLQDRQKVLESQRSQLLPGIDKTILMRYEKILGHKEGLAIAPVTNSTCGGCFMNVTQQTVNALKMQTGLVECEICSRILYLEDDH